MELIPKLRIGELVSNLPIIQGAMGVYVSRHPLPGAVIKEGGIGTVSSICFLAHARNFVELANEALTKEIRACKEGGVAGAPLAVNVMEVLGNALELIKTAVAEKIRMLVVGAGLWIDLPRHVEDPGVALVPMFGNVRAAGLVLRNWDRKYGRIPSAVIVEGPLAGGHLGHSLADLADPTNVCLERILPAVLRVIEPYEQKYGIKIPVIAAGGVHDGHDIARMLRLGASGVQMATNFVVCDECSVHPNFKRMYLDCSEEDLQIIKSPVGMPGRAINNPFLRGMATGVATKVVCPFHCLKSCKREQALYCIAERLLMAYNGDVTNGLVFAGAKAHLLKQTTTVRGLFRDLLDDLRQEGFVPSVQLT
ncbi:MAG: nitronate monooxygenase family protein [Patescibacteria group bacterium]